MQRDNYFGFGDILQSNATQSFAITSKESGNAKRQREEEQRRKEKQERELRQREKDKKRADALRLLEIYSDAENGLKRPTEFVCKMKFFNTLPDVPSEPKFVDVSRPLKEFGEYYQTSLELNHKYDLIVAPDLSLDIDMIDPDRYVFSERPGPLAPEDEVLLNAEREFVKGKKSQGSVPWLRPSEIITANFDENMYNQSRQKVKVAEEAVPVNREIEQYQISLRNYQVVEKGFEEANDGSLPVHPTNKSLKVAKVQHVIPCKDFMSRKIAHVLVEAEPAGSTFADEDRKDAVFFSVPCGRNQEALLRGVPKRGRDEENDDDLDELFGEANADEANGALFLKSGVFAPRAIQREGMRGKFILVSNPDSPVVGYFPLDSRIELHDLNQDYRGGSSANVPKKYRVATREETQADLDVGIAFWNSHFQETLYEEEDEEEEGEKEGDGKGEDEKEDEPMEDMDLDAELKNK